MILPADGSFHAAGGTALPKLVGVWQNQIAPWTPRRPSCAGILPAACPAACRSRRRRLRRCAGCRSGRGGEHRRPAGRHPRPGRHDRGTDLGGDQTPPGRIPGVAVTWMKRRAGRRCWACRADPRSRRSRRPPPAGQGVVTVLGGPAPAGPLPGDDARREGTPEFRWTTPAPATPMPYSPVTEERRSAPLGGPGHPRRVSQLAAAGARCSLGGALDLEDHGQAIQTWLAAADAGKAWTGRPAALLRGHHQGDAEEPDLVRPRVLPGERPALAELAGPDLGQAHEPDEEPQRRGQNAVVRAGMADGSISGWPGTDSIEDIVPTRPAVYDRWAAGALPWTSAPIVRAWQTFGQGRLAAAGAVHGGTEAELATSYGVAGRPMFEYPPGCYLDHEGSFITGFTRRTCRAVPILRTAGLLVPGPGADFRFFSPSPDHGRLPGRR